MEKTQVTVHVYANNLCGPIGMYSAFNILDSYITSFVDIAIHVIPCTNIKQIFLPSSYYVPQLSSL